MSSVVFVYPGDPTGATLGHVAGAGRLRDLATSVSSTGVEAHVVAVADDSAALPDRVDGLPLHLLAAPRPTGLAGRLRSLARPAWVAGLTDLLVEHDAAAVVLYGTSLRFSPGVRRAARAAGARCFTSVNEWGSSTLGLASFAALKLGLWFSIVFFDGCVVITDYMARRVQRLHRRSITVPALFDLTSFPEPREPESTGHVTIAYAGSVANRKDHTHVVLQALASMPGAQRERIRLHVVGAAAADLAANIGPGGEQVLAACGDVLVFHDYLPRAELRRFLSGVDHTVLVRPREPYAMAGFPTKVAESMVLGVPPVANLTSDLAHHLVHRVNSVVLAGWDPPSVAAGLAETVALHDAGAGPAMRERARAEGRRAFDHLSHGERLRRFLGA